ncbi:uncharacterized protein LOC131050729 isoform X1 [Cryptomeria japonica]|uniref:uncharacterized protein LOC131050729 isoform X1 n=1 Tax=Cryptomeria japonica TaxID=3369 RepID=UPI0025AD8757|nr:uncharacterized protein LOC131050729 isoform X1 [Cryptomeria japonica]
MQYNKTMDNNLVQRIEQQKPLLVYQRRNGTIKNSEQLGKSDTTASSSNNKDALIENQSVISNNNDKSKVIFVYRRKRKRITTDVHVVRITTDTHVVKLEAEAPECLNSSDSPMNDDFTSIITAETIHSTKGSSAYANGNRSEQLGRRKKGSEQSDYRKNGSELLDQGTNKKKRPRLAVCRSVQYELRSTVSRPVQSQLSTTAEEAKPDVSATSELTQVVMLPNKASHRAFQRARNGAPKRHRRYLKYSTILKNTNHGIGNIVHGNDSDVCQDVEDYMGDERKRKVIRTIESLYAFPADYQDFYMRPWYLKSSTMSKDLSYESDNSKITRHGEYPDLYTQDEDDIEDERKKKVFRSIESLYVCSLIKEEKSCLIIHSLMEGMFKDRRLLPYIITDRLRFLLISGSISDFEGPQESVIKSSSGKIVLSGL